MINATKTAGGTEKQVFNSILSTHTGGVGLDLAGYVGTEVPAGKLVSKPDPVTGLSKIVTITGDPATFDLEPLGLVEKTVKVEDHTWVGVVTGANVKEYCLPQPEQDAFSEIHEKIPTLHPTI